MIEFRQTSCHNGSSTRPDLIVSQWGIDNTLSVLLNTTAPGASTATFAIQTYAFATGKGPTIGD